MVIETSLLLGIPVLLLLNALDNHFQKQKFKKLEEKMRDFQKQKLENLEEEMRKMGVNVKTINMAKYFFTN